MNDTIYYLIVNQNNQPLIGKQGRMQVFFTKQDALDYMVKNKEIYKRNKSIRKIRRAIISYIDNE